MKQVFVLDTDVISETSKARPHPKVIDFLRTADNVVLPAAALMELQKGIMEICARSPIKAVKLSKWYQELTAGEIPIAPSGKEVLEIWGTLAADRRLRNLSVPRADAKEPRIGQDLHIAATALTLRAVIATFNVKDYMLINECYPLPGIFNPMTGVWHAKMKALQFPETITPR